MEMNRPAKIFPDTASLFFIAACLGVLLRYLIIFPAGGVTFSYVLHDHSHIMFFGWAFNMLSPWAGSLSLVKYPCLPQLDFPVVANNGRGRWVDAPFGVHCPILIFGRYGILFFRSAC